MKIKEALREFGEKKAVQSIDERSAPRATYQPKPPTRIQQLIDKAK